MKVSVNYPRDLALLLAFFCLVMAVMTLGADSEAAPEQAQSTQTTHSRWQAMGLSQDDITRYESLRAASVGLIDSENLTPFEVLGITATDPAKRRHYARLLAQANKRTLEQVQAFEAVYREEVKKLYGAR